MLAARTPDLTWRQAQQLEATAWSKVPELLERIVPPVFPNKDLYVTDFGAQADTARDSHQSIQEAIDSCSQAGGGRVIVPAGTYLSQGPLHLKNNVNLHLAEGAMLRFEFSRERFSPLVKVRWEGTVCWNYSPLIYAIDQTNIALTGKGTIDGNGEHISTSWRKEQKTRSKNPTPNGQ